MHRRFMAVALAASSLVAVALAAPEVAQSKPLRGQQAEAQNTGSSKSTKVRSKRTTRAAVRARGRTTRKISRRFHASRAGAARSLTQNSNPYADDRFNYGPLTVAPARNTKRRQVRRSAPRAEAAQTTNGYQDERFNYGPRTATVRNADRHRGRNAMARAHAPSRDRDGSSYDGPRFGFGSSDIVSEARRYVGTNPTGRRSLWCGRFMNFVLTRSGYKGTGSDMASSFARYGRRISGPQVGAIAVMSRGRRGGHVGVVSGIDENGNPIIISGNHGNQVAEAAYPRGRVYAYVMPH